MAQAIIEKNAILHLGEGITIVFDPESTPERCVLDFYGPNGEHIPMNYETFDSFRKQWTRIRQLARLWNPINVCLPLSSDFDLDTSIQEMVNVTIQGQDMLLTHKIIDVFNDISQKDVTLRIPGKPCFRELQKIMRRLMREFYYKYHEEPAYDSISSYSDELEAVTSVQQRNRIVLRNRRRYIRRKLNKEEEDDDTSDLPRLFAKKTKC